MTVSPDEVRIRLSIMDLIRDDKASLKDAQDALYRDDPDLVAQCHQRVIESLWGHSRLAMGDYGSLKELPLLSEPQGLRSRRPCHDTKPPTRPQARRQRGMTIREIAGRGDLWGEGPSPDKETLYRLLEENYWLERAPFGREQSRWFVTDKAVEGGYGPAQLSAKQDDCGAIRDGNCHGRETETGRGPK